MTFVLYDGRNFTNVPYLHHMGGEQSVEQISNQADRLEITAHELFLYSATDLEVRVVRHHDYRRVFLSLIPLVGFVFSVHVIVNECR